MSQRCPCLAPLLPELGLRSLMGTTRGQLRTEAARHRSRMEAWPAGAATARRAHPGRARLYCYIKVPRPPLRDGKPPVCGDGGPCGKRASRSGLPFGSHEKEPGFVRQRPGGGSAGCGPSRIRGAGGRLRSRDLPSLAPRSGVLPTVACKAICIFSHPPLPGFGNCGLKQGDLEV